MTQKRIFIIAGENSGDIIGSKLLARFKQYDNIIFLGIGGPLMISEGLDSIFPMSEISIMGFMEVITSIPKILKLINLTVKKIEAFRPDVIITIDSPGFTKRVASRVKKISNAHLIHVVAPTVWAYNPGRAKKYAQIFDLLFTLFPFEPPYFEREGLKTIFAGQFIFENDLCHNPSIFRKKNNVTPSEKLICLTPGSRTQEVMSHLSIFLDALLLLKEKFIIRPVIVASSEEIREIIKEISQKKGFHNAIITLENKYEIYKAADLAIAKSGTNSLEIAMHETPQLVCYKVNFFTWLYIKSVIKIKYANIINIIAGHSIIPELLQKDLNAQNLAAQAENLLMNQEAREEQINNTRLILASLKNNKKSPSEIVCNEVMSILSKEAKPYT